MRPEIRELVPEFKEQARQQYEDLKALIIGGSLDVAMLPIPPQLPAAAAEAFRALVAAGPKHVETVDGLDALLLGDQDAGTGRCGEPGLRAGVAGAEG